MDSAAPAISDLGPLMAAALLAACSSGLDNLDFEICAVRLLVGAWIDMVEWTALCIRFVNLNSARAH